jgi:hypothetical protein
MNWTEQLGCLFGYRDFGLLGHEIPSEASIESGVDDENENGI